MNFAEQIAYLNRSLSAGQVIARGNPIRPEKHPDHPGREVLGITFQLGTKEARTVLRVWDHQATAPEDLDPLCDQLEQLILTCGDE